MSSLDVRYCPSCGEKASLGQVLAGGSDDPFLDGATGFYPGEDGDACVQIEETEVRVFIHADGGESE